MPLWGALVTALPAICALAAAVASPVSAAEAAPAGSHLSHHARAAALFKGWSTAFGLEGKTPPPNPLRQLHHAPRPPHLEPCTQLALVHARAEGLGGSSGGSGSSSSSESAGDDDGRHGEAEGTWKLPKWASIHKDCPSCPPKPPWVRGADSANLPLTRTVQRDLWLHQFPPPGSCAPTSGITSTSSDGSGTRRLLLTAWPPTEGFGMGSQLHVVSAALSLAVASNRTLVLLSGSYERARHSDCAAMGHEGDLRCYFFPSVSSECEQLASSLLRSRQGVVADKANLRELLSSSAPLVVTPAHFRWSLRYRYEAEAAWRWGSPWRTADSFLRTADGRSVKVPSRMWQVNWWRSQSLRFLLRWPSAYLCHLTNRARHQAYGFRVALKVAAAEALVLHTDLLLWRSDSDPAAISLGAEDSSFGGSGSPQDKEGRGLALSDARKVTVDGWSASGGEWWWASESAAAADVDDTGTNGLWNVGFGGFGEGRKVEDEVELDRSEGEGVRGRGEAVLTSEPFIFRPIVSLHVRQGDKGGEMRLFSFSAFLYAAARLRMLAPDLKHVWLSTEMQSVVDESKRHEEWMFLHTNNRRQAGADERIHDYERQAGVAETVGSSFANLIIASQCDAFVGTLGSNWNRLINEMRLTNGRMRAPFVALNHDEW